MRVEEPLIEMAREAVAEQFAAAERRCDTDREAPPSACKPCASGMGSVAIRTHRSHNSCHSSYDLAQFSARLTPVYYSTAQDSLPDTIGFEVNLDSFYTSLHQTPCKMKVDQHMKINCPTGDTEYEANHFLIDVGTSSTTICRDSYQCAPPH